MSIDYFGFIKIKYAMLNYYFLVRMENLCKMSNYYFVISLRKCLNSFCLHCIPAREKFHVHTCAKYLL